MDPNPQTPYRVPDDEIDLADLLRQLWAGKWIILITTLIFVVGGIIYSVYKSSKTVKEYQSQVTLFVESPSPDSLVKVFSYPPFFTEVLETELTGLPAEGPLTVKQVLEEQTPPAGSIASLMSRVTASVGNANTLVISVQMQDPGAATQLADSVVQKLFQFLQNKQVKQVVKRQELLKEDSLKNVQTLMDNSKREMQYLVKENSKNIQFLTEALQDAETVYRKAQQALTDFYRQNSTNLESIDSLEIKRLNADIQLKYNVYSNLYEQLDQAKISSKNQLELAKLNASKQLEHAKLRAEDQIEQVKLSAEKQQPVITIMEPASAASQVNFDSQTKIPLIMLFLGVVAGVGIVFGRKFWMKNFSE